MRLNVTANRPCTLTVTPDEFDQLMEDIKAKRPPSLPAEVIEHLKSHGHVAPPPLFEGDFRWSRLLGVDVFIEGVSGTL